MTSERRLIVAGSLPGKRFNIGQWGVFINVHLTAPLRIWGARKQGPVWTILLLWTELSWWRDEADKARVGDSHDQ